MKPDAQMRNKLKDIRDKLAGARSERTEAMKERDAARDAFAGTDFAADQRITETAEFKAAEEAVKKVGEIDDRIADLKATETAILQMLGDAGPADGVDRVPGGSPRPSRNWDGHRLLQESEEFRNALEMGVFNSTGHFGTVTFGEVASREDAIRFLASAGQGGMQAAALPGAPAGVIDSSIGYIPPDFRGVIPPRLMSLNLLDLIPTGTTDSNIINYVQVTAIPASAAETAEHAVKPEEGLSTVDATAPVRTIAGWIKASRQSLDDVAGLATLINTLLPYDVRRRILTQILAGNGVGQNLLGIYNTTGVLAPAAVATDNAMDAMLRAMTQIILSDSDPNFVALNPISWQNMLLAREGSTDQSGGNVNAWRGEYLLGGPGMLTAPTIWGMTLTQSRAIPQGAPLVGDAMGCSLLVREGVNVKTSDSDQDDFVRNRVTILAEARVAFPVWRPSAFAIAAQG